MLKQELLKIEIRIIQEILMFQLMHSVLQLKIQGPQIFEVHDLV